MKRSKIVLALLLMSLAIWASAPTRYGAATYEPKDNAQLLAQLSKEDSASLKRGDSSLANMRSLTAAARQPRKPKTAFGRWALRVWHLHRDNELRRSRKKLAEALAQRKVVWDQLTPEQRRRWIEGGRDEPLNHILACYRAAIMFFEWGEKCEEH